MINRLAAQRHPTRAVRHGTGSEDRPPMKSAGYKVTPRERGKPDFIRRNDVARIFISGDPNAYIA